MGCLLAPLKGIWTFLKWSFTSGWKGLIVLILVIALLGVGYCQCQNRVTPSATKIIEDKQPGIVEAPYQVETISRCFNVARVNRWGSRVTLTKCWERIGSQWQYSDKLVLDKKVVGEIVILKR